MSHSSSERAAIELDVTILGGGFAGVYCAKALGRGGNGLTVGLISEDNYMVFQPMLPEVAGASISPRHVVNPLRLLCRHAQMLRGRVESIDWPGHSLTLNAGPFSGNLRVSYKHLVLALGAVTDLSRIPGLPEHSFLIKNVGDAMHLRATLLGRIEEANLERRPDIKRRLLTFVVVGGGFSGVETAGHILDLFDSINVYYPHISASDLQVYLVHSGDHLLPTLSRKLGEYSGQQLRKRGLNLILNERVQSVTANRVYLQNGSVIESNTVISTVGNAPHPLVVGLCEREGLSWVNGRIVTEPTGQVKGRAHLWAAGDCAAFPAPGGGHCPDTAQFAMRQGKMVGQNILRHLGGKPLRPFTFQGLGELASIGHRVGVADIFGRQFSGFFAWWLWRTVYLIKLPRFDRKVRVLLDWTLDLFFPRDLNHLSPRYTKPFKEIYLETGDVLFRQGEPAFSLYLVKSGALEVRDGEELVHRVGPGGYYGERALLGEGVWQYDGRVPEPTRLVSIPASLFRELAHGIESLGQFFQKSATKYQSREVVEAIGRKISEEMADRPIGGVMERELHLLRPGMTMQEALRLAHRHPRSSYPVVDGDRRLLGTITRENFYEFLKKRETGPATLLEEMNLTETPTVAADRTVREVMECFIRSGSNKVMVVDEERRLEGIATVMDLMTLGVEQGNGEGE